MEARSERLVMELRFPPQWARIDRVAHAIGECVAAVFEGLDVHDSLCISASELLENAIKYGTEDSPVRIVMYDSPGELVLEVTNALGPGANAAELGERIAWISSFENAAEAYQAALLETANRPEEEQREGGLGLVRIAYEGASSLSLETPAEGFVTVRARMRVGFPS